MQISCDKTDKAMMTRCIELSRIAVSKGEYPFGTGPWAHRNLAASSEHDHTLDPIRVERRDHAGDALTKVMANDDDRAIVSRRQVAQGQTRSSGQCCLQFRAVAAGSCCSLPRPDWRIIRQNRWSDARETQSSTPPALSRRFDIRYTLLVDLPAPRRRVDRLRKIPQPRRGAPAAMIV
jgi:hypothetical protein